MGVTTSALLHWGQGHPCAVCRCFPLPGCGGAAGLQGTEAGLPLRALQGAGQPPPLPQRSLGPNVTGAAEKPQPKAQTPALQPSVFARRFRLTWKAHARFLRLTWERGWTARPASWGVASASEGPAEEQTPQPERPCPLPGPATAASVPGSSQTARSGRLLSLCAHGHRPLPGRGRPPRASPSPVSPSQVAFASRRSPAPTSQGLRSHWRGASGLGPSAPAARGPRVPGPLCGPSSAGLLGPRASSRPHVTCAGPRPPMAFSSLHPRLSGRHRLTDARLRSLRP